MAGYVSNIEEKTLQNDYFRQVLFTAPHSQLVVMSLLPGEEIGTEVHNTVDQFLKVEEGMERIKIFYVFCGFTGFIFMFFQSFL